MSVSEVRRATQPAHRPWAYLARLHGRHGKVATARRRPAAMFRSARSTLRTSRCLTTSTRPELIMATSGLDALVRDNPKVAKMPEAYMPAATPDPSVGHVHTVGYIGEEGSLHDFAAIALESLGWCARAPDLGGSPGVLRGEADGGASPGEASAACASVDLGAAANPGEASPQVGGWRWVRPTSDAWPRDAAPCGHGSPRHRDSRRDSGHATPQRFRSRWPGPRDASRAATAARH